MVWTFWLTTEINHQLRTKCLRWIYSISLKICKFTKYILSIGWGYTGRVRVRVTKKYAQGSHFVAFLFDLSRHSLETEFKKTTKQHIAFLWAYFRAYIYIPVFTDADVRIEPLFTQGGGGGGGGGGRLTVRYREVLKLQFFNRSESLQAHRQQKCNWLWGLFR